MTWTKRARKTAAIIFLGGALSFSALYGCSSNGEVDGSLSGRSDIEALVDGYLEGHENAANIEEVTVIQGTQREMDLIDLVSTSDLVVSATIDKHSDSIMVEPINSADPRLFTDVQIRVAEVLYDPDNLADRYISEEGNLVVRLTGGVGYRIAMVSDYEADLVEGETYLLFLYKLDGGSFYNTEGLHMYIQGHALGAWRLASGVYVSPGVAESLLEDDVASAISDVVASDDFDRSTPSMVNEDNAESQTPASLLTADDETVYSKVMTQEEQIAYEDSIISEVPGE